MQPRVKSLRSSYTGLYHPTRGCIILHGVVFPELEGGRLVDTGPICPWQLHVNQNSMSIGPPVRGSMSRYRGTSLIRNSLSLGTSLIRKSPLLGTYSSICLGPYGGPGWGGLFLMSPVAGGGLVDTGPMCPCQLHVHQNSMSIETPCPSKLDVHQNCMSIKTPCPAAPLPRGQVSLARETILRRCFSTNRGTGVRCIARSGVSGFGHLS